MENLGAELGCDAIPATDAAVCTEGLSSLKGECERCGVTVSGIICCRKPGMEATAGLPSRELVAAGVRGGECAVDVGGETRGEASVDHVGRCLRLGVVLPEGTFMEVLACG